MAIPRALKQDKATADAYIELQIGVLISLYENAELRLLRQLHDPSLTDKKRWRIESLLKQVDNQIKVLDRRAHSVARATVGSAYVAAVTQASEALDAKAVYFTQINTQTVSVLAAQMTQDLLIANGSMKSTAHRFIRATQQQVLMDTELTRVVAEGIIEGVSEQVSTNRVLKKLQERLKNGQLITINGRNYNPAKYAELLSRTRTREAATQATINTSLYLGNDLVQVSAPTHRGKDSICPRFAGRVYSISGSSPDFPRLTLRPPFHPNCIHVLAAVLESALKKRKTYDALVVLSNSDKPIETHKEFQEALRAA